MSKPLCHLKTTVRLGADVKPSILAGGVGTLYVTLRFIPVVDHKHVDPSTKEGRS